MYNYLKSSVAVLKYSFRFAKNESIAFILILAVTAVLPYLNFYFLGSLINKLIVAVNEKLQSHDFLIALFVYALIIAAPRLISAIKIYINKIWNTKLSIKYEVLILQKRLDLDVEKYEDSNFQDLMKRAFRNNFWPLLELSEGQFQMIKNIIAFLLGSILAIKFGALIYCILIITSIPSFITEFKYGKSVWTIWARDTPNQRRMVNLKRYFEYKSNIIETKLLQSGNWLLKWIYGILEQFREQNIRLEKRKLFFIMISELVSLTGFILAAFLFVKGVVESSGPIGNVIFVFGILTTVRYAISEMLVNLAKQYEKHLVVEDILKILNTKSRYDQQGAIKLDLSSPPTIEFVNVSFKYPFSDQWGLKEVNLKIAPGERVALVGENGSGKSTFVKLVCRIYDPTEGKILVNGFDLKDIDLNEWWSYLGVMMQDYANYNFKVKDTIAIGRIEAKEDMNAIINAASISNSDSFIERWEQKYLHEVGVEFDGVEPSKGQRQKLSLAKIIYRKAYLTILDEPCASIDTLSEIKIFDSLKDLRQESSLILISHNLSAINWCDNIYVFSKGYIIERGSHRELMIQDSVYAKIFKFQAERFSDSV
ncbi:ABC transporter ATP-binding protein [Fulvivirga sediminis]|uniref:ABC transporter ATP-binding protein n=1 Tax=Fulvivirga sediminis TaxID=2803949 RepID=A0A937FDR5_9BACT|nr:ABC transporter ATP-binding protein [Fulvivirga sediminis]MBL3659040.1 ABC transporter ATP-binding protein [Fulvivirga sediminis]